MRNKHKHIEEALGVNDAEGEIEELEEVEQTDDHETYEEEEYEEHSFEDDFILAQKTLREMLEVSCKAVQNYREIADMEESPRHFEVLGTLISNTNDTAERLMKLHTDRLKHQLVEQKVCEGGGDTPALPAPNTTPAVAFIGTTSQLLDELHRERQKSIIDVTPDDKTED
jgi:hypothetical protein